MTGAVIITVFRFSCPPIGCPARPPRNSYEAERRQVALEVISITHRMTRLATVRSPVARRLRNILLAADGRDARLPRRLAKNLAEKDIVYRDGWSMDGSTAVARWPPKPGVAQAENLDPDSGLAFRLVVPERHKTRALAAAACFPDPRYASY